MKLRKITAAFLAVLICVCTMSVSVSAAKKSIKLDQTKVTLAAGETCTLKPSVTGYKKATVQWSSSDKSVATVKKGVVTAVKEGTAKITVKIKDTKYKATCTVTVTKKTTEKNSKKTSGSNDLAKKTVADMKIGWNLGNALDATGGNGLSSETSWGNPKVTKAMIDAVKKAGFNTIRIPVSWGKHMDSDGKVDSAWLDRVQEVVDYAYDNKMYVIVNVHHDADWIKLTAEDEAAVSKKYKYLWQQIAERFKNYDEKLIFEGINEPRTIGSAKEWTGGTKEEWEIINRYCKVFVSAVRSGEGYNKTRLLMLTPYGASPDSTASLAALEIPDDDGIIVSIHAYKPYNSAFSGDMSGKTLDSSGKKEIDRVFSNINKYFISKGIPVIIGEFGAVNKGDTEARIEILEYFLSKSEELGIPCCLWDNGATGTGSEKFGMFNRNTCEWYYPEIIKAIMDSTK